MNTKLIMTVSAIILGASGVFLTFAPEILLDDLKIDTSSISLFLVQVIGGLYFGYGMLNWMNKGKLIGGIYNRPVAVANFTHFLVVGLAIIKMLVSNPELPLVLWTSGVIYFIFALLFCVMLFRHPISADSQN